MKCKWCDGRGWISFDGGSLRYACEDCNGSGLQSDSQKSDEQKDFERDDNGYEFTD